MNHTHKAVYSDPVWSAGEGAATVIWQYFCNRNFMMGTDYTHDCKLINVLTINHSIICNHVYCAFLDI